MSVDIMSATVNTVERVLKRMIRIEYGTVVRMDSTPNQLCGVQCRDDPHNPYWNTVTVKIRSVKNDTDKTAGDPALGIKGTPDKVMHHYCLVLQGYSQKFGGHPYTPRIGDMVAVLFILNQKPIVLGTVYTNTQDPVCRAPFSSKDPFAIDARYDDVIKWSQWERPTFDRNEEVIEHFPGKHPICDKTFHRNRDQIKVTDCKEGSKSACKCCTNLDHIKRCGNQWEKIYSCETDAKDPEHPYLADSSNSIERRHEYHEPCGSYLVYQNYGNGKEQGKGLIRLENATCENQMKAHLNMSPRGTVDIHTEHSDEIYFHEQNGVRMSVVSAEDIEPDHSFEAIDFATNSLIEILKNGNINISSLTDSSAIWLNGIDRTLTLDGDDHIWCLAHENIELITDLTHVTNDLHVDGDTIVTGTLTHGGGPCCNISTAGWESC